MGLRMLGDSWSPAKTSRHLLVSVLDLLSNPEPRGEALLYMDHGMSLPEGLWPEVPYWRPRTRDREVAALFHSDHALFERVAQGFGLRFEFEGRWKPSLHHLWP